MRWHILQQVTKFYRKFFKLEDKQRKQKQEIAPISHAEQSNDFTIIPRDKHIISRQNISENAIKVLHRLNKQGFDAYLVGGCVRDLLLGRTPKDFDVTTNATPEQVQKIFRNCRLVGRRFRLAHIIFGRDIIEVATFRNDHRDATDTLSTNRAKRSQTGMLLRDNVYGTIAQDAMRRDFTINCLYYSIKDFTIRDYCHGLADLNKGIIRLIGDPETRYREDPVRMLRAVRFAAKLEMTIEPQTAKMIPILAPLLSNIAAPRLFDEMLKLLQTGYGFRAYQELKRYHLFASILPTVARLMPAEEPTVKPSSLEQMTEQVLKNTDYRLAHDKRVNPAFLLAALLWYPLVERTQELMFESGLRYNDAFNLAISDLLTEQCAVTTIPKRLTSVMSDIWRLQLRFNKRTPAGVATLFTHQKFRAAYDLLELRAAIEKGELLQLAKWWDEYQLADVETQQTMVKQVMQARSANRQTKRRYQRKRPPEASA